MWTSLQCHSTTKCPWCLCTAKHLCCPCTPAVRLAAKPAPSQAWAGQAECPSTGAAEALSNHGAAQMGRKGFAKGFALLWGKSKSPGAVLAGEELVHYLCWRGEQLLSWLRPFITCWAMQKCPPRGYAEQCAACHWLPSQGRIFTSQGASLHGSAFIESLANPTNFEEKSLCSQAAGASCGVCEARRGMPPSMHSNTGGTAQCRKPPLFATRDYSDNFREVTGVPSSSHPLAVPRVAAKPHLYQDIWLVPLRAKALLTT